jgi:hypothetical protein
MQRMTTVESITDRLHFRPPFLLKIDDEERLIEEPAELVNVRDHFRVEDEISGTTIHIEGEPFQGTVTLLVNGKVVASATYSRKGPRVCEIIRQPDNTFAIHFVSHPSFIKLL